VQTSVRFCTFPPAHTHARMYARIAASFTHAPRNPVLKQYKQWSTCGDESNAKLKQKCTRLPVKLRNEMLEAVGSTTYKLPGIASKCVSSSAHCLPLTTCTFLFIYFFFGTLIDRVCMVTCICCYFFWQSNNVTRRINSNFGQIILNVNWKIGLKGTSSTVFSTIFFQF